MRQRLEQIGVNEWHPAQRTEWLDDCPYQPDFLGATPAFLQAWLHVEKDLLMLPAAHLSRGDFKPVGDFLCIVTLHPHPTHSTLSAAAITVQPQDGVGTVTIFCMDMELDTLVTLLM